MTMSSARRRLVGRRARPRPGRTCAALRLLAGLLLATILQTPTPRLAFAEAKPLEEKGKPAATPAGPAASPVDAKPAVRPRRRAEAEHVARLDAAIAPVRDIAIDLDDAKRIREAIQAISDGKPALAAEARGKIVDPLGRKLALWFSLWSDRSEATQAEIDKFLATSPGWPGHPRLRGRSEKLLFLRDAPAAEVHAFFKSEKPRTGAGHGALALAFLAEKKDAEARRHAALAWRNYDFDARTEQRLLEKLGKLLKPEDHKWRLDRLLMRDLRWRSERNARGAAAARTAKLMGEAERKKAEARLQVYLRKPGAAKAMAALPTEAAKDWGMVFQRIQVLRRSGKDAEARALLRTAPIDPALAVSLDDWWVERRLAAYEALKEGRAKAAYELVKAPGTLSVNERKDAAFFAGWLALRHLRSAKLALPHFELMLASADGPRSRAKANYWMGRTQQALGRAEKARSHYRAAMASTDTFYGLLARQTLSPGQGRLHLPPPPAPSADEIKRFNAREVVRAAVIAHKVGQSRVARIILLHLRHVMTAQGEAVMLAHLAGAMGDTQMSIRIAKTAGTRGFNLIHYSYPTHPLPAYKPLRQPPEPALLLSIARQESEFNTQIRSGAGARGILQVMPITARHVCRDYKIKCELGRLMTDPAYNTMIASAYIGDRLREFKGNYVLLLAGYNAGPGRVRQWIREFGDPRTKSVDAVDWIERIPFEETREYVAKVLSNVQIYRARLGKMEKPVRLADDLGPR
ncbi:MAG: transglycosylase SLT domain-containing protein [Hyphomicrobiaceae bacterium]